jgi:hypothetical protein
MMGRFIVGPCPASLETFHQVNNFDGQRVRNDLERLNGDVALAPLYFPDMGAIQPRPIRKHILRPPVLESKRPHLRPDLLLDVLHLKAVSRYSCFIHTGYNLQWKGP